MGVAWAQWFVYGLFLMTLALVSGLLVKRAARIACVAAALSIGIDLLLVPVWLVGQLLGIAGSSTHAFFTWWLVFGWAELLAAPDSTKRFASLLRELAFNLSAHLLISAVLVILVSCFFGRLTGRVT